MLGSVVVAADWAEFVGKCSQAFEAKAVAAVKSGLLSFSVVVLFMANIAVLYEMSQNKFKI